MLPIWLAKLTAMAAFSCTGLPVASSFATSHIDGASTSVSSASRDVKPSNGVGRAAMEPCVGCIQSTRAVASPGSRSPLGLGRTSGLSDVNSWKIRSYRNEEKSRGRLEIVQQAAPPILSFPERNSMKNLETGSVLDVSGTTSLPFWWLEKLLDHSFLPFRIMGSSAKLSLGLLNFFAIYL